MPRGKHEGAKCQFISFTIVHLKSKGCRSGLQYGPFGGAKRPVRERKTGRCVELAAPSKNNGGILGCEHTGEQGMKACNLP